MLKKLMSFLGSVPATIISGISILLSFIFAKNNISTVIDVAYISVILCGIPILIKAVKKLTGNKGIKRISSALLISVAMIASIIIGDLFAAGEVAFIMAIGGILEDLTAERAKKGLKKLISLSPAKARLINGSNETIINASEVKKGDIIRILAGETVAVDGVVVNGESSIDQSVITGESLPVDKTAGDTVYCGTQNLFGAIDIKATNVGEDSSLQKLINLVANAEKNQAPMARIADKAASFLVPIAFIIAVLTGILTKDIIRAVTVLVVFCPCSLVLATPTAIMAAVGQATKQGVIIKSGEALEKMGKVTTVTLDKTGTLTKGCLTVSDIIPIDKGYTENEILSITASAERKSEHPLGKAIVAFAATENIKILESDEFKMAVGKGVTAKIENKEVACGKEEFLLAQGISLNDQTKEILNTLRSKGKVAVIAAVENEVIGIIALSDTLRTQAKNMISKLTAMNTETVLLTGDNKQTADYFAEMLGINTVFANLLPEQKVEKIEQLKAENRVVCMIGDGINDAPALKTSDVGCAMGTIGSDIAVESADIALMSDDISKIPYLKRLATATVKTIKFSISLSMTINLIAVTLSVLGLLTPTTGALVHNAG